MSLRLRNERMFHDRQAEARARALQAYEYLVDDEAYLQHESWIAPAFAALGNVHGRRVLDLGCGHGMASVVLARRGAIVTACDLSLGYLREARRRADANGVDVRCAVCDGDRLPFADAAFDAVWGNAILHHLDLDRAGREVHRVLRPGGVAVFCEPWGGNRLLNWARRVLPYPSKQRTLDETPLGPHDLTRLRAVFPDLHASGFQLLAMLGRVIKTKPVRIGLAWCDEWLMKRWPGWQRYGRYLVLALRKNNERPTHFGLVE